MRYKIVAALAAVELLTFYKKQKNRPPSIRGVAETVHSLPGRMRLMVPGLVGNSEAGDKLQGSMESLEAVTSTRVNPVSGSVVVSYDPESVEPVLLFGAVVHILGLDQQLAQTSPPVLWREIDAAGKTADDMLRTFSLGLMDIKTLVTLLLMGVVAYRMFSGRSRLMLPGTGTLIWWGLNLMILRGFK